VCIILFPSDISILLKSIKIMIYYDSKLPNATTTIFTIMSNLARNHKAINLSQGFPDFNTNQKLIDLVTVAMNNGFNQYPPVEGVLSLREVISQKVNELYGTYYDPNSEITITSGASQGIFTVISAFIKKGDEVIVFQPAYDQYEPSIQLNGGKVIPVYLKGADYSINWEEVANKINSRTRMIVINTPHNPTGTIFTKKDLLRLESLVKDTDIIILSDEVYGHIIYDDQIHQSVSRYPKLVERSFVVSSFGKTFHTTGWKTGYCLAPKNLMTEFRKVHQFNVFCSNHPIQHAFYEFLKCSDNYLHLPKFYQQKRDLFLDLIKDSRFTFKPSKGTYFQLLNYEKITNENDVIFAKKLISEHKIASIPVSVFNQNNQDDKVLRFCFAKTEETLYQAAEILCKL
jgi:methionine aminotransferase